MSRLEPQFEGNHTQPQNLEWRRAGGGRSQPIFAILSCSYPAVAIIGDRFVRSLLVGAMSLTASGPSLLVSAVVQFSQRNFDQLPMLVGGLPTRGDKVPLFNLLSGKFLLLLR